MMTVIQGDAVLRGKPENTMRPGTHDNVQRFTLAGAAHEPLRGDPEAGIRAGERKTC